MIKIILDSGSDFTSELLDKYNVSYLQTEISYKGEVIPSSLRWDNVEPKNLINYMKEGNLPEISQPAVGKWVLALEDFLKEDKDIAYLAMSSSLAGAVKSFNIAKNLIKTNHRLEVFEIAGASATIELIALEILNNLTEETSFEDIKRTVDNLNSKIHFYGLPESLKQWAFSGRAQGKKDFSYPAGYPVMKGNPDGSIRPLGIYSSFDESLNAFINSVKGIKATKCVITYSYDTYLEWIEKVKNVFTEILSCKIIAENIHGPTTTCVAGINTIDVAFF